MLAELERPQNPEGLSGRRPLLGEAIGDPALRETYLTSQASLVAMLAEIAALLAEAAIAAPAALAELIGCSPSRAPWCAAPYSRARTWSKPMLCALLTLLETNP